MATGPTIITVEDARQGDTGHNVRYVLGFGLVLAIISMINTAMIMA